MSARQGPARGPTFFIRAIGPARHMPPPKCLGTLLVVTLVLGCSPVGVVLGRSLGSDVYILFECM